MNKSSRIKRKTKIRNLYKIPIAPSGKANVLAQQSIQIMFLFVNAVGQDRFKKRKQKLHFDFISYLAKNFFMYIQIYLTSKIPYNNYLSFI